MGKMTYRFLRTAIKLGKYMRKQGEISRRALQASGLNNGSDLGGGQTIWS